MITYSLIKGAGLGLGYSVVLATATPWFPNRRGLVVGMIVGGFGLGALIFTPIQTAFINPNNVKVDNVTSHLRRSYYTSSDLIFIHAMLPQYAGGVVEDGQSLDIICSERPGFAAIEQHGFLSPAMHKRTHDFWGLHTDLVVLENCGLFGLSGSKPTDENGAEDEKKRLPEEVSESQPATSASTNSLTGSPKGPWAARVPHEPRVREQTSEVNLTPKQVLRRLDFYLLWFVMFCNIIPITIITSAYKLCLIACAPDERQKQAVWLLFGQAYISDDLYLSIVATISSLFNSGGRMIWGSFVDKYSFKIPLCVMLSLWSAILISFPHLSLASGAALKGLYALWVCLLFLSLSGVFAIMPAATGILFGPVNLAVNYGLVFNAFAAGSVICGVITSVVNAKDAYLMQFTGCGVVCLIEMGATRVEDRQNYPYHAANLVQEDNQIGVKLWVLGSVKVPPIGT
ncbi:unnamed protein product [Echinostoma caproni]|uniref:Oxalate:formate antiporter n=1 Tax=Echinostoma caproni TaxID=27848 RepID=A0A183AAU0_9TREM|nr:unnamed protein product [Echinostoma caproni]